MKDCTLSEKIDKSAKTLEMQPTTAATSLTKSIAPGPPQFHLHERSGDDFNELDNLGYHYAIW